MAIDVANDELIEVAKVAKRFPVNGKARSFVTMRRWILNGVKGTHDAAHKPIKLEAERVGGTWYTTEDAVRAFSAALTKQSRTSAIPEKPAKKQSASHKRAVARLKARGICK